jgi:hypothetical protein
MNRNPHYGLQFNTPLFQYPSSHLQAVFFLFKLTDFTIGLTNFRIKEFQLLFIRKYPVQS